MEIEGDCEVEQTPALWTIVKWFCESWNLNAMALLPYDICVD
jgi:hypothetical protein